MATTVDHLGADRTIRILKSFIDLNGVQFHEGETGVIRRIDLDRKTYLVTIQLDQGGTIRPIALHEGRSTADAPRSGNLRTFFEVSEVQYFERDKTPAVDVSDPVLSDPVLPDDAPHWTLQAAALEQSGRLEEAEKVITAAIPHLYSALEVATMYRERWKRLLCEGDAAGAREARQKSADWAYYFASLATSGGEGTALSRERDQFLRSLGPEPF